MCLQTSLTINAQLEVTVKEVWHLLSALLVLITQFQAGRLLLTVFRPQQGSIHLQVLLSISQLLVQQGITVMQGPLLLPKMLVQLELSEELQEEESLKIVVFVNQDLYVQLKQLLPQQTAEQEITVHSELLYLSFVQWVLTLLL